MLHFHSKNSILRFLTTNANYHHQLLPSETLLPQLNGTKKKQKKKFLTESQLKSQSHICRRLDVSNGHFWMLAREKEKKDGLGVVMCKGFYVYLEVITTHNPLFRVIILFAFWMAWGRRVICWRMHKAICCSR